MGTSLRPNAHAGHTQDAQTVRLLPAPGIEGRESRAPNTRRPSQQ